MFFFFAQSIIAFSTFVPFVCLDIYILHKECVHSQKSALTMVHINGIILICYIYICVSAINVCIHIFREVFEVTILIYNMFYIWNWSYVLALFQWSDVPLPFKDCSASPEGSFGGQYEAAFCAPAQLLPDAEPVRTTPPASDASVNVFETQDSTAQVERDVSAPPLKKSRPCPHTPPDLRGPHLQPLLSSERVPEEMQDELTSQKAAERAESSTSEEQSILPQHSALCVC